MHAILISSETVPEILTHQMSLPDSEATCDPTVYLRHTAYSGRAWYYIQGYYEPNRAPVSWGVLPAYRFEKKFNYDPEKIKTEWTVTIRK